MTESNQEYTFKQFLQELKLDMKIREHFWIFWDDYKFISARGDVYVELYGKLINRSEENIKSFECVNYLERRRGGDMSLILGELISEVHVPANAEIKYTCNSKIDTELAGHQKLRELKKMDKWPLLGDYRINSRINRLEFTDGSIIS